MCQDISVGKQGANNMEVRTGYREGIEKPCLGIQVSC